jgi:DNA-binding transcriptional MerR regulator/methylmalonyl-CoA mutase cobalamin-binding subunit
VHTISWVADQLGVVTGTVRAWEQRYGIVRPVRSAGGYRLYSDADVDLLRAMARLIADGMQPAQAAAQLLAAPPSAPRDATRGGLPDPAALLAAARRYDAAAVDALLDEAFAAAGFEYVVDTWLTSALNSIGRAWESGQLDVSQEHFISAGVMRRLAAAFDASGYSRSGRHVVIGLAPGATHEIATLAFATMLRRRGLRVTYLGPDLPVASWVTAVRSAHPDAAVVGAPRERDRAGAGDVVRALTEAAPEVAVYSGGPGAASERALPVGALAQAADWVEADLTRHPAA